MAHTFTNLIAHVVFSTKERRPTIKEKFQSPLFAYMGGIIREMGGKAFAINGTENHVHLLIKLPPVISVAEAMRVLKTNSSRWAHEKGDVGREFGWQAGYGAFSVSRSNAEAVIRYIANQKKHHQKLTFQEEYLFFLKKHGLEFDERFIWD